MILTSVIARCHSLKFIRKGAQLHYSSCVHFRLTGLTSCISLTNRRTHTQKNRIFTVPNVITLSRIALTPLAAHYVLTERLTLALSLVVIAGISDALDGYVARKFRGQQSWLGSYLDPIADKMLITALVLSLGWVHILPGGLALLIVGRDCAILSIAGYLSYLSLPPSKGLLDVNRRDFSPIEMKASNISKFNTFCQLTTIVFSISASLLNLTESPYLYGMWVLTAGTTLVSGVDYLRKLPEWKRLAIERSKRGPFGPS